MDQLEALLPNVGLGTGWALLLLGMFTGKIMTRSSHQERVVALQSAHESQLQAVRETYQSQVDDISHDRGEWRTESRIKDAQFSEGVQRNHELLSEVAQTVTATFDALKANVDQTRGAS